jgi:ABC-type transporter Mla MlaB component
VYVHGKLSGEIASALLEAASASVAGSLVMVVHLTAVRQITAAGLGTLMDVRRRLLDAGLTLSLAGLGFRHRFLLHAWCAHPLFDEWESTVAYGRSMANDLDPTTRKNVRGEPEVLPAQTRVRG